MSRYKIRLFFYKCALLFFVNNIEIQNEDTMGALSGLVRKTGQIAK